MADGKSPIDVEQKPDNLEALFRSPIPKMYFNGFGMAMGTSDVTLILQVNNMPIAILNTPYEVAKALGQAMTTNISEVEQKAKVTFHTITEIAKSLEGIAKAGNK